MARQRALGKILLDLEPLMIEMAESHDLQHGDILNLVRGYLEVHLPGYAEEFTDGDLPIFYYGSRGGLDDRRKVISGSNYGRARAKRRSKSRAGKGRKAKT